MSGLMAVAALAGLVYLGSTGYEKWRAESGVTVDGPATEELDPDTVRAFYDDAIRAIEEQCDQNDRRCEARVKKETAADWDIPESQAEPAFFQEGLRRAKQGR